MTKTKQLSGLLEEESTQAELDRRGFALSLLVEKGEKLKEQLKDLPVKLEEIQRDIKKEQAQIDKLVAILGSPKVNT